VRPVDQALDADGLLAEVDQEADVVSALLQVEQALLDIFWQQRRAGLGRQDQLLVIAPNDEIHPTPGYEFAFIDDGHLNLALELQAPLLQGDLQGALVVRLHAVKPQHALHVHARPQHPLGALRFRSGDHGHSLRSRNELGQGHYTHRLRLVT
jgi:hypothetical protein